MIFKKIQSFWKWIWKDVKAGQPEKAVEKVKAEIKEHIDPIVSNRESK